MQKPRSRISQAWATFTSLLNFLHYSTSHCCYRKKTLLCRFFMLFCSTKHCCSCCCSTTASCHRHHHNSPFSASLNTLLLLHQLTSVEVATMIAGCRNAILGVVQLLNVCCYCCFSTTMPWSSWQRYRTELGSPSSMPLLLVRMTRKRKLEKGSHFSQYGRYFTFKLIFVLSFSVTKFVKQSQNTSILLS